LRAAESRPLGERLGARWQELRPELRPTSKLAEAIDYALHRRVELSRFLDDGRIELDTGHLERSLRPVDIGRKIYLFYGSFSGGRTAATLYSVGQLLHTHVVNDQEVGLQVASQRFVFVLQRLVIHEVTENVEDRTIQH
jgi:hypothetical protein